MRAHAPMQVVDLISLKPFDMETIAKSIKKTRRWVFGGWVYNFGLVGWMSVWQEDTQVRVCGFGVGACEGVADCGW